MHKFLNEIERKQLLQALQAEHYRKQADRIRVILLLDQGWTYKKICEAFFIDESTIANWKTRYKEGGLERLFDDKYKVKKCFLSPDEIKVFSTHLENNIYQRTSDIALFILKKFGVEYKPNSVRRLLKFMGFSYKKTKKQPSKSSIDKQIKFINQYHGFKSHGPVYFADSTHPRYCPVMGYGWIKTGVDRYIECNSGRSHLNITGAVNPFSLDVITRQTDTVGELAICNLLKEIKEKNIDKNKIYVVLDNASYNKSKKVKYLAKVLGIRLKYLPPYSPNLNLAERLWRFFRERVMSMKHYESLDIFSKVCSNFFRGIRKYRKELCTLLVDNFQIVGT